MRLALSAVACPCALELRAVVATSAAALAPLRRDRRRSDRRGWRSRCHDGRRYRQQVLAFRYPAPAVGLPPSYRFATITLHRRWPSPRRCKPVAAKPTPELRPRGHRRRRASKNEIAGAAAPLCHPPMDKEHQLPSLRSQSEHTPVLGTLLQLPFDLAFLRCFLHKRLRRQLANMLSRNIAIARSSALIST